MYFSYGNGLLFYFYEPRLQNLINFYCCVFRFQITSLKQNSSRQLLSTLSMFFKIYPLLWIFLLSTIAADHAAVASSYVTDFLLKVIKDVLNNQAEISILQ